MPPKNLQTAAYLNPRPIKQHEEEMLALVKDDWPADFSGRVLDIGCAAGVFLKLLGDLYPKAQLCGIDLSHELLELASARLAGRPVSLQEADALEFAPEISFDIIIASGILSVFEDFAEPLRRWLAWLSDHGRLYIFGRFNSREIDTITRFRNNFAGGDWEAGLTSYSVRTVEAFLRAEGCVWDFRRFHLRGDLTEAEDPIRTYTIDCADGSKLVVNGANIIAEQYFLSVWRSPK